jgi:FkbM family methyltransferase
LSVFVRAYALARRAGLVDRPWFDAVFERSYFLYKRLWEDPFYALTQRAPELFRGGHILDVGANIGYTAVVFARALSPGFGVLALEPEADNFAKLERAVARRGLAGRVTAVRAAAGARDGEVELWRNLEHHGDHRVATERFRADHLGSATVKVPQRAIDSLVAERGLGPIAFVKIDVQGYEPEVLRGMTEVLATNPRMAVAFEYAPAELTELGYDPGAAVDLLLEHGHRLHVIRRGGRVVAVRRDELPAATGARGYVDVLGLPPR